MRPSPARRAAGASRRLHPSLCAGRPPSFSRLADRAKAYGGTASDLASRLRGAIWPPMAHDVFISYSSQDKPIADAICATLEQNAVRCWIVPRDIRPGADWGESIVHALAGSRVFVLVLSGSANRPHRHPQRASSLRWPVYGLQSRERQRCRR
jgi:TIR domain